MSVRVRFSPAPTGVLHVGNARTALFNWLYARHTGGTMILRVEDTDPDRSTQEAVEQIRDVLTWLGLDWDEGPYVQSERLDRHRQVAEELVASGDAYECYCTKEELDERAAAARLAGEPPGYDGHCRDLDDAQRAASRAEGRPVTVRFRTPLEGRSSFGDVVLGEIAVEWSTVRDFVLLRSDGTPIFYLANAVDDVDMRITHVIRGADLVDTTHRVLAIRRAMGHTDQPVYAHCPLILGPGGHKLSKRYGAVHVEEFRAAGYLPEALVNYLALLGWGTGDDDEVMGIAEIAARFELTDINSSPATFDARKLEWINGEHIRRLDVADLTNRVRPFVVDRIVGGGIGDDRIGGELLAAAVALGRERAATLVQLAEQCCFLFTRDDDLVIDGDSFDRLAGHPGAAELLAAAISALDDAPWTIEGVDLRPVVEAAGQKPRKAMHVFYSAIEGRAAGLPLWDSMVLLGRDSVLTRLRRALARLGSAGAGVT
jgi:glutamyl-tRNA synthetase